jgi:hypothetical protein
VPVSRLASLQALRLGDRILALGTRLPALAGSERFWGEHVLTPLGFAPEPALPESVLRQAAGLRDRDLLLLRPDRAEFISRAFLSPLSRATLRLAVGEVRP